MAIIASKSSQIRNVSLVLKPIHNSGRGVHDGFAWERKQLKLSERKQTTTLPAKGPTRYLVWPIAHAAVQHPKLITQHKW